MAPQHGARRARIAFSDSAAKQLENLTSEAAIRTLVVISVDPDVDEPIPGDTAGPSCASTPTKSSAYGSCTGSPRCAPGAARPPGPAARWVWRATQHSHDSVGTPVLLMQRARPGAAGDRAGTVLPLVGSRRRVVAAGRRLFWSGALGPKAADSTASTRLEEAAGGAAEVADYCAARPRGRRRQGPGGSR